MKTKSKPCPFCGCENIGVYPYDNGREHFSATCENCLACGPVFYDDFDFECWVDNTTLSQELIETVIKLWNRRA
jgi:Lar family restriction alleviation protein